MSDQLREALEQMRTALPQDADTAAFGSALRVIADAARRLLDPVEPDYKAAREHHRRINEDVDPPYKVVDISGIVDAAIGDRILIQGDTE